MEAQTNCIKRHRLSKEEKHVPEKSKQASSVVNLILPQVRRAISMDGHVDDWHLTLFILVD